jgi:hypothetical protein
MTFVPKYPYNHVLDLGGLEKTIASLDPDGLGSNF